MTGVKIVLAVAVAAPEVVALKDAASHRAREARPPSGHDRRIGDGRQRSLAGIQALRERRRYRSLDLDRKLIGARTHSASLARASAPR